MLYIGAGEDIERTVLKRFYDSPDVISSKPDRVITAGDLTKLFLRHGTAKKVMRQEPEVTRNMVADWRALLIAHAPDLYEKFCDTQPLWNHHLLVDANVSQRSNAAIRNVMGPVTHVNLVGLTHKDDRTILQWAMDHRIEAIVTHDVINRYQAKIEKDEDHGNVIMNVGDLKSHDLTDIAILDVLGAMRDADLTGAGPVDFTRWPLIIHCPTNHYGTIAQLFAQHGQQIHEHIQNRSSPTIRLMQTGVAPGSTYETFYRHASWDPPGRPASAKQRHERWAKIWINKIKAVNAECGNRSQPRISEEDMLERAQQCLQSRINSLPVGPS